MAKTFGTLLTLDTLATLTGTTVYKFGEDAIFEALQREIAIYNTQANEVIDFFCERTTQNIRRWGDTTEMEMQRVDQVGVPDAQKPALPGNNLGFPLWRFALLLQWNRTYFERATPAELARKTDASIKADRKNLLRQVKTALFYPTNTSFVDTLNDNITLPVKALANNDGMNGPMGPNGEVFDWTAAQNHYLATAALTAANITAAITAVNEHYADADLVIYIPQGLEVTIRGFTANFKATIDARLRDQSTNIVLASTGLRTNSNNRLIGLFDQAEVWVKPWMPANYIVVMNRAARKPLAYRTYDAASGDFRLVYQDEKYTLRAQDFEREFGIGVQERTAAAILYTGGGAYVTPTFP